MDHFRAILIKLVATLVLFFIILGLGYDLSFWNIVFLSLILGIVSYLIGDLFLLRRTNNTVSTIADFGLSFIIIWFYLDSISNDGNSIFWATLLSSIGVTLFEYFFHKYMANNVLDNKTPEIRQDSLQYQTEASEEIAPDTTKNEEDK